MRVIEKKRNQQEQRERGNTWHKRGRKRAGKPWAKPGDLNRLREAIKRADEKIEALRSGPGDEVLLRD